jgi:hypothetical protein
MDPEDRAPQQHQPDRPERLEDARIDVLDRLVAEQQPLADKSPFTMTYTPAWIASRRLRRRYCIVGGVMAEPMVERSVSVVTRARITV